MRCCHGFILKREREIERVGDGEEEKEWCGWCGFGELWLEEDEVDEEGKRERVAVDR